MAWDSSVQDAGPWAQGFLLKAGGTVGWGRTFSKLTPHATTVLELTASLFIFPINIESYVSVAS